MEGALNYEQWVTWIKHSTQVDSTYPYHCMAWYREQKKARPLSKTEEKVYLWLKDNYGLDKRE